jgi:hypothetical protein
LCVGHGANLLEKYSIQLPETGRVKKGCPIRA